MTSSTSTGTPHLSDVGFDASHSPGPAATTGPATTGSAGADDGAWFVTRRYPSPVGELVLIGGPAGLAAVLWPDDERPVRVGAGVDARTLLAADAAGMTDATQPSDPSMPSARTVPAGSASPDTASIHELLDDATHQLDEYFAGTRHAFDLALAPVGTAFQVVVWRSLARIAYGETATYGQQAERIGRPTAVRAVGAANGRNPLSIVLPCHRVVGSDGRLTGFAGGLDAKAYLLEHEARHRRR